MAKYAIQRTIQAIPLMLLASIVVFLLIHLAPGDPALLILGFDTPPEFLEQLRSELGLDLPLPTQYIRWISHALRGDLGMSYWYEFPVLTMIKQRLPATLELTLISFALTLLVAFPSGILAAIKERTSTDMAITAMHTIALAIPNFWFGLLLILLFSLTLRWLPPSGRMVGLMQNPRMALRYLALPSLCLALRTGASLGRFIKSSLLDVLTQDYVRTARAKGLNERLVIVRHVLPNALIPVLTVMGIQLARLLSGVVVIETVFAWPGLGLLAIEAISHRDYAIVQGTLLFSVMVIFLVNLLVDLLYGLVDPRVRLQ
jgi:peptide/nickel transport system permease protein